MPNARTTSVTVQTVVSGSSGNTVRPTNTSLQMVISAISSRLRTSKVTVQTVTASIANHARSAYQTAQVVWGGSGSGSVRDVSQDAQVVYTIGFQDLPVKRAWWFEWDGHVFYCLDLGNSGTLAYDLTTSNWTKFDTAGYEGAFNFKNGLYWRTGRKIVGGDAVNGRVWEMIPDTFLDEGWRPVFYEVRGIVFAEGNDYNQNYSIRLIGSSGRTADTIAPVLYMRFSDDEGQTWSAEYSIALDPTKPSQRLEFKSLGAFAQPGRIFRLYDTGGIKYIGRCEVDIGV